MSSGVPICDKVEERGPFMFGGPRWCGAWAAVGANNGDGFAFGCEGDSGPAAKGVEGGRAHNAVPQVIVYHDHDTPSRVISFGGAVGEEAVGHRLRVEPREFLPLFKGCNVP